MTEGIEAAAADGVLTVSLDRPEKKNALDQVAQRRLVEVLESAALDESLRVIHLTAAGDNFCSGSDWVAANNSREDQPGGRPRPASLVRRLPLQSHRVIELLLTIQLPVVASVRGIAAGMGCQLALAADFTVAAEDASFWEPFVLRGFTPDTGSTWLLPRLAGLARARRMLLLGELVTGSTAAEWGLIHEAVPAPHVEAAALALVDRLAGGPTVALGLTKQQLVRSAESTLTQALADESYGLELAARTSDFREGLKAFSERRDPQFRGN
ncbi:2-(1,2-epoxy-1,2-dihydrophenyl)acetyl-CoA isomerase [Nocardioides ginsengisegetis]|uniref:2-(1,2-epoxy-1,2-dihydrophenyl)acetyl-CoA isomerase n=1 Tax=Nocardioides ginsengisegetis TaxID=661491 RepID=A0A7W3J285_9ACTN|nr:2-(1,2-epoxy-1,2-dihydrophenyl)acetyl-CoA isomerase [Nocardioides ginsengisegetis]